MESASLVGVSVGAEFAATSFSVAAGAGSGKAGFPSVSVCSLAEVASSGGLESGAASELASSGDLTASLVGDSVVGFSAVESWARVTELKNIKQRVETVFWYIVNTQDGKRVQNALQP